MGRGEGRMRDNFNRLDRKMFAVNGHFMESPSLLLHTYFILDVGSMALLWQLYMFLLYFFIFFTVFFFFIFVIYIVREREREREWSLFFWRNAAALK